ncbi:ankyrin repeat domain-containing protein 12 isoform X2 [Coregonus clupeaformis]|uniref:ankyrin repeat domain-containing protein 12 isoform X2 n=1 Tax=Coregonus clupeaformis TaxID=59861 RepID=UPI001BE00B62|nr:ankyrin repeat domain-containing protein 12 isoform X2 [Coregonus clupeaformis]
MEDCNMAKPGTDRDGAMVGKKSKDKISPFTKTLKLDRSKLLVGKDGKPPKTLKLDRSKLLVGKDGKPPKTLKLDRSKLLVGKDGKPPKTLKLDRTELLVGKDGKPPKTLKLDRSKLLVGKDGKPPKTLKLDRSKLLVGKDGKPPKSSMKRKLSFTEERHSDADKDGPDKKKNKKESGGSKKVPVNLLFGYPLSERKQMALLMQMTARDNSPDSTPSHPSQAPPVQKKPPSSSASRARDKVNKRNERGETPLHMAAIRGDAEHVKELISLGADVNIKDFAGWTPLHEACNLGFYDVAKVLIAAGAEVNTQGLDDDTPLHDASSSGHTDIVKLLLRHGGNAFQANRRGERPVDVADSQELKLLLKGEVPLSDAEDSSSESEGPLSVNPSSVDVDDDNLDDSDVEKDSDGKQSTVKASSSMSGLDEYEFKDEEEEEDLSKALNDRHILRRELRQREKEEKERNHLAKQSGKGNGSGSVQSSKSKKTKTSSRVRYCSSDSSSDEMEMPTERRSSPTCSNGSEGHKASDASRTKKENVGSLTTSEQKDKSSKVKKKNKSKNKENQEDGKENSKALVSETHTDKNSRGLCGDEDSFKISFSPKDDSSVHLFHLSATVNSPKLNYGLADKQPSSNPLKQENAKMTCVSIAEGPCPPDGVKYNHYNPESEFCTESSSSKGCKHKEKSKHHQKDVTVDCSVGGGGVDGGSSLNNKEGSVANSVDSSEGGALQKMDKDGKVVKKHKLKHKEKDNHIGEYEADRERNRHRQKEGGRKDGHRNLEFDREFWKENFFNDDEPLPPGKMESETEREDGRSPQKTSTSDGRSPQKTSTSDGRSPQKTSTLDGRSPQKTSTLDGRSPQKTSTSDGSPEERGTKEKRLSSSKETRREEQDKDKDKVVMKERKETSAVCKEEKGGKDGKPSELEERTECLSSSSGRTTSVPDESQHNAASVKDELEDKPVTGTMSAADLDQLDASEKDQRDKSDRRPSVKERETEKTDKKHPDKEKKVKMEHLEKSENSQNSMDRWREKERVASGSSHSSPGDKNHKESEKLRASSTKKHEESKDKKSKEKPDKRSCREREYSGGENRDRIGWDNKGKPPSEKFTDHSKSEKDKDKDCDKKKREISKDGSFSSSSNLKLPLEEKKGYVSESGKTTQAKLLKEEVPEKDGDRRDRESRDSDRHRDRDKDKERLKGDKDRSKEVSKASKTKPNETETDRDNRSKAKASPATREEKRPKEKRLVNEDLRQTSFERMLSLKDQEIEQWHRKHLEKIKQKERERMKQRPSSTTTDPGKLKSKAKTMSLSSGEQCSSKELLRSEGSGDAHGRDLDKPMKEITSSRTMSLDGKILSSLSGKLMPGMENSLSRSPRPESERSGLMSRSVSMFSVASSEDSCQATMLTPRPVEYDSDMTLEASQDSQPPFLQCSLLSRSRSPAVHDKDYNGLPDSVQGNRTPLQSRHTSPYLMAILDEDANSATAGKPFETLSKASVVPAAQPSEEPSSVQLLSETCADPEESQSQRGPTQMLPNFPNARADADLNTESEGNTTPRTDADLNTESEGNSAPRTDADLNTESEGNTAPGVHLPPQVSNTGDPHVKDSSTLQQAGVPQLATPAQRGSSSTSDPLLIRDVRCIPVETSSAEPECSRKELPSEDTVASSSLSSRPPFSSLSASQSWQTLPNASMVTSQQMQTETDPSLALDPKDKAPVESAASSAENRAAVEGLESALVASRQVWMDNPVASTSAHTPPSASTEESVQSAGRPNESQEDMDTNASIQDCKQSRFSGDDVGSGDPRPDKNDNASQHTPSTVSRCPSPEHKSEETSDAPDCALEKNRDPEAMSTGRVSCWSSSEGSNMVTVPEVKSEPCPEPMDVASISEERSEGQTLLTAGSDQTQSACGQCSNYQQGSQTDPSGSGGSYSSSGVSASSSPQSGDRDSDSSGAKAKVRSLTIEEGQDVQQTHPRKRKMPRTSTSNQARGSTQQGKETPQQSLAAIVDSLKLEEIEPYQTERANPYYEFLHIRKKIEEKRKVLLSVIPQPPQYYDEYVTFTGSYLLDGNPLGKLCIPTITPPPSLPDQLKEMFKQQEVVRMKLRLQHSIEREKLIVSNEQEVLRVHYRAARTLANQTLPFSACTVLLDAEVYNMPQDAQASGMMSRTVESGDQDGKTSVRDRFNARQFMSWLQDVDDKFDKLKTCLLMRQQHEAAALNAVQRLHWQLKLQELDPAMYKSTSIFDIPEFYIPLVEVNDDFDLTPI